jgi:hypothetical protein
LITPGGVLTFLFRTDGSVSRAALQVSSETCLYLKLDLWALLDARFTPHPVAAREAIVSSFQNEMAHRLPVEPLTRIASAHPTVRVENLQIASAAGHTLHGLVIDGVN